MKLILFILFLSIYSVELRLKNDDIYELDDLLKKYERHNKYQSNNDDDDDDDQDYLSSFQHKKNYPSHRKVLKDEDDEDPETDDTDEEVLPTTRKTTASSNGLDDTSLCFNDYNTRPEELVKVKELKNGAHMIKYTLIDKRRLSTDFNIRDYCMLSCCTEKTCDLAMLSEQPTHEGYKCYLFACNGSCILASGYQDYTVLTSKKDSLHYTTSVVTQSTDKTTSVNAKMNETKHRSFFRETSVIIFLLFGIISTIVLFVFIFRQCRDVRKRGRKTKNCSVDADYLINGLYL